MRVLLIISNCGFGGAEKNLIWLANELVKDGVSVTFYAYENYIAHYHINDSVHLILPNRKYNGRYIRRIRQGYDILKVLYQNKFDTVVSFLNFPNYFTCFYKLFFNYRLLISDRGDPNRIKGIEKVVRNILFNLADAVVLQSLFAERVFPLSIRNKTVIIKNFINFIDTIPDSNVSVVIGCVGRFVISEKRQDLVLRAFKLFSQKNPNYILGFYGDGPDRATIESIIVELGLVGRVKLFGYISDMESVFTSMKVLVSASDTEGIPNVILEAMAYGIPVIATDYSPGGVNELIIDSFDGYIVARGDFETISNRLDILVNDDKIYFEMSKQAQNSIRKFSERKISEKWRKVVFNN